ncbi:prepilin-type N-terminal cleavage/methylation domain-containing protein [Halorhodospira neutriphila]|uniref:prepilin-type N-terminal cleavage/methylation domain-containing protein n=1 Tax=Halorhodospira neutriphila TaxID=168379 RepID=UPI0019058605|nr:prepilin-type N-terminal cleavage/methylation domain-containing protein [Halorhodospira neutriphila]
MTHKASFGAGRAVGGSLGFTLAELIVVMLLMALVAALATRVLGQTLGMWSDVQEETEERAEQAAALERMVREVREASEVKCQGTANDTLWVKRQDDTSLEFKAGGGVLTLRWISDSTSEQLSPESSVASGGTLCECKPDSHHLVRLSLSEEVETHVYPRNAECVSP